MPQPDNAQRYTYERHRPEETPLYQFVETDYPEILARLEAEGGSLPQFVKQEFDDYLKCGLLEHGFLRVECDACSHEHLVAFSCERRGFCPSCGAGRMVESAANLVDHFLPEQPIRQWVLTVPYPLRGAPTMPGTNCRPTYTTTSAASAWGRHSRRFAVPTVTTCCD